MELHHHAKKLDTLIKLFLRRPRRCRRDGAGNNTPVPSWLPWASHPTLVFVDADVRLTPHGLIRLVAFLNRSGAHLISGLPQQEMQTFVERLMLPLMHFLLLGFLPRRWMRRSRHPAYGTGCGQLFMTRREAYKVAGGHAAIRASLHDGLTLPRAFRRAGLRTDLCDASRAYTASAIREQVYDL